MLRTKSLSRRRQTQSTTFYQNLTDNSYTSQDITHIILLRHQQERTTDSSRAKRRTSQMPQLSHSNQNQTETTTTDTTRGQTQGQLQFTRSNAIPLTSSRNQHDTLLIRSRRPPRPCQYLIPFTTSRQFLQGLRNTKQKPQHTVNHTTTLSQLR